jgi:hypothetical protein
MFSYFSPSAIKKQKPPGRGLLFLESKSQSRDEIHSREFNFFCTENLMFSYFSPCD